MIEIQNLTKTFGPIKAVDNLTLHVPEGSTVGFLGPNGAMRPPPSRYLTNLISRNKRGAYMHQGGCAHHPKLALASVGAVVGRLSSIVPRPSRPVLLGSIRGMHTREIKTRTEDVLHQVKLNEWRTTRIGKFSKGMKQRLAIAQALLHEPDILILDEPTSGLDPRGMVEVREIIRELKKQKYTIFMSSHLLMEVQETCDSAALIDRGKLLVYDSIVKLKGLIKSVKIEVTSSKPLDDLSLEKIRHLKDVKSIERVNDDTFVLTFEGNGDERAKLLTAIQASGIDVTGFSPIGLPLEMMYMDLIKESR
jgi:ABC-2 type transport system ATP-binding protein